MKIQSSARDEAVVVNSQGTTVEDNRERVSTASKIDGTKIAQSKQEGSAPTWSHDIIVNK